MAWTIDDAFKGFHAAINLSGDNRAAANKRKDWVVGRLAGRMAVLDAFTGVDPVRRTLSGLRR